MTDVTIAITVIPIPLVFMGAFILLLQPIVKEISTTLMMVMFVDTASIILAISFLCILILLDHEVILCNIKANTPVLSKKKASTITPNIIATLIIATMVAMDSSHGRNWKMSFI